MHVTNCLSSTVDCRQGCRQLAYRHSCEVGPSQEGGDCLILQIHGKLQRVASRVGCGGNCAIAQGPVHIRS